MQRSRVVLTMVVVAMIALGGAATAQVIHRPGGAPALRVPQLDLVAPDEVIYFSTEEDFVARGPKPPDGNPVISDGDLLTAQGTVFLRNAKLLQGFDIKADLGLDAADVIRDDATRNPLVAFSTELDHRGGAFTAGDIIATNGAVIPNAALLATFKVPTDVDLGLDALQFIGKTESITKFLQEVRDRGREFWAANPNALAPLLERYTIDIWFSTEGTPLPLHKPAFLDGDVLSAMGAVVIRNEALLPNSVPAGIPNRGVDFGLDALATRRFDKVDRVRFSTEILFLGRIGFNDGDILKVTGGGGVAMQHWPLIKAFEPPANFLGLDALSLTGSGPK